MADPSLGSDHSGRLRPNDSLPRRRWMEVLKEPLPRQVGNLLQRAGLFKQMRCAWHNLHSAVYSSISSSADVSRSISSVPSPTSTSWPATKRFRLLNRLLPLPCANNTTPCAPCGNVKSPSSCTLPAGTRTVVIDVERS